MIAHRDQASSTDDSTTVKRVKGAVMYGRAPQSTPCRRAKRPEMPYFKFLTAMREADHGS